MSVRCFYVDESYDREKFCLSAISVRHNRWRECFDRVQQHRRLLNQDHGIFIRKEIHAHEFVAGRGRISDEIIGKHARSRIFHGLLMLVAELPEVAVFNVCIEVKGRKCAFQRSRTPIPIESGQLFRFISDRDRSEATLWLES